MRILNMLRGRSLANLAMREGDHQQWTNERSGFQPGLFSGRDTSPQADHRLFNTRSLCYTAASGLPFAQFDQNISPSRMDTAVLGRCSRIYYFKNYTTILHGIFTFTSGTRA